MSEELRALAEAATPGPWEVYMTSHAEAWVAEVGRGAFGVVSQPATGRPDYGLANAAFIAAANPMAVLALLDERDALRAQVERVRDALARAEQRQPAMDPRSAGVYVGDIRAALDGPA